MSETIVVHGYVGSGKSTQCSRLVSEGVSGASRVQHVSAGNRLRGIRNGTEASKFSQYINDPDAPSPLPDWIVEGAVFEAIDSNDSLALIEATQGILRLSTHSTRPLQRVAIDYSARLRCNSLSMLV